MSNFITNVSALAMLGFFWSQQCYLAASSAADRCIIGWMLGIVAVASG